MQYLAKITDNITQLSTEHLALIVSLAAFALAGFAIYAIHSMAKGGRH